MSQSTKQSRSNQINVLITRKFQIWCNYTIFHIFFINDTLKSFLMNIFLIKQIGLHSLKQFIFKSNMDPYRSTNYKKPVFLVEKVYDKVNERLYIKVKIKHMKNLTPFHLLYS